MRYPLLNLLACPMCKNFPLELTPFELKKFEKEYKVAKPFCDTYCARHKEYIKNLNAEVLKCEECVKDDVVSGILLCGKCGRWYPIIEGIPFMYPDNRRQHPRVKSKEEEFLKKFWTFIPDSVKERIKTSV